MLYQCSRCKGIENHGDLAGLYSSGTETSERTLGCDPTDIFGRLQLIPKSRDRDPMILLHGALGLGDGNRNEVPRSGFILPCKT